MISSTKTIHSTVGLLLYISITCQVTTGTSTHFASHVSVNTPTRSFTHGVGDPISLLGMRKYGRPSNFRGGPRPIPIRGNGYPRVKPALPFTNEDTRDSSLSIAPWQYIDVDAIPLLPPSPYRVNSPDPESLWPEGLFLPPIGPPHFGAAERRSDAGVLSDPEPLDPYLLEGSYAIAAVVKAKRHGHLFFHDIPHIESLLANQELRVKNNLTPHKIGSIRHTWPYNRP